MEPICVVRTNNSSTLKIDKKVKKLPFVFNADGKGLEC